MIGHGVIAAAWLTMPHAVAAQVQAPSPSPGAYSVTEAAGCAPTLTYAEPPGTLRLISSLDPAKRLLYGPGDTLIVNAGATSGLRSGQEYFVRRLPQRFGTRRPDRDHPVAVHTAGWIRILAVEPTVATAAVVHACDGMFPGDYLEPFTLPSVASTSSGQPRYDNLAAVLGGDEDRSTVGSHEFVTVDRGSDHGIAAGDSFVVLRDTREPGAPLVQVGEGIVLIIGPQSSTAEITRARDAIRAGDLIAFRK